MAKMKAGKLFFLIFGAIILVCSTYYVWRYYENTQEAKQQRAIFEKRECAWNELKQKLTPEINQFKGTAGIVIKDLETNWEYSYNKDKLFPSASLAKIPIMASCFLAVNEGRLKLDKTVKVKSTDKTAGSGILKDVHAGTSFTVEELIGFMIYDSDNTATGILTDMVGIGYLNKSFKVFGLKNTNLSRKIADFRSRNKGIENYTTAEDMVYILEKIYRRNLVNKDISEKCLNLLKLQRVNDRIPKYLPVDITIAHKTGLERGVCHDVGIVFSRKGNFLICILTKYKGSNSATPKEFIAKVALYTFAYFEQL